MINLTSFILRQLSGILPLAYMGLIWFLSSHPSDAFVNTGLSYDRVLKEALHLIEFGLLYCFGILALLARRKLTTGNSTFIAVLSSLYGLIDEIHQYFVPQRSASFIDLLKDITGVALAWFLVRRTLIMPDSKLRHYFKWVENTIGPSHESKQKE